MKRLTIVAMALVAICVIVGCKPSTKDKEAGGADSAAVADTAAEKDTTMYGKYLDGGHGAFELQCADDSVRDFVVDIDKDSAIVFGSFGEGDQMAVTYWTNEFGERIATKVINLTTLQATWTSLDKDFEIEKGGTVQSHQQGEARPWTSWRILNGHLVLNSDTFDIDRLDGDSLFLENKDGVFAYARKVKK